MLKNIFDFFVSTLLLALLAPLIILLALIIFLKIGRPIFLVQMRPGFHGTPFKMYKFRSMNNSKDKHGKLLPDDQRLDSFGKLLRATSLDEIPSLLNVIKGDMSLVGPRPLLMEYLQLYDKKQARRHDIKPGITGWAQVNGRNAISWKEKFDLDVWYVDNQTFLLDIKIIIMTVKKVLFRENINAKGVATMTKFKGNKK